MPKGQPTVPFVKGITGNAVERGKAATARMKADKAAHELEVIERRRVRAEERRAAGLNRVGHKRTHAQTKRAAKRAKVRAELAAKRAMAPPKPQRAPKRTRRAAQPPHAGYGRMSRSNERNSKTLIRELKASIPAEQWERVLQAQAIDSPGGKLLAIMSDPRMGAWTIERQCAEAGVKFQDLVRMVSDHSLGSALVASTRHVHEVVEGVAESAKTRMLVCKLCLGLRDTPEESSYIVVDHPREVGEKLKIECPDCGGVGRVRRDGSPRAVETFLKLHGGLEESTGPTLNVNTQVNFNSQHSMGVQRGQQLLEMGRQRRLEAASAPIAVTATRIESPSEAAK